MKKIDIPIIKNNDDGLKQSITINETSNKSIFDIVPISVLYDKYNNAEPFTKEDLISLYDIYNVIHDIEDVDYEQEVKKRSIILNKRNRKIDMAQIFDCDISEIADNVNFLLIHPERYIVLLDSLAINYNSPVFNSLKYITGSLRIKQPFATCDKLPELESIKHDLFSDNYIDNGGIALPKLRSVGRDVNLGELIRIHNLSSLEIIGGNARFYNLRSADCFNNLKYIYGNAYFDNLIDTSGLSNLKYIGGAYYFTWLSQNDKEKVRRLVKESNNEKNKYSNK